MLKEKVANATPLKKGWCVLFLFSSFDDRRRAWYGIKIIAEEIQTEIEGGLFFASWESRWLLKGGTVDCWLAGAPIWAQDLT